MSEVVLQLERVRKRRLMCYIVLIAGFLSILVANHILNHNSWLYYLVILNDCILLTIGMTYIEIKLGYQFSILYEELMSIIVKSWNQSAEYEKAPINCQYELFDNKLNAFDASSRIDHIVRIKKLNRVYELLDTRLYINTYRSNKIPLFKGYLMTFHYHNNSNELLILNNKKPLFGDFKLKKDIHINPYKIYTKNEHIDITLMNQLRSILEKNNQVHVYIGNHIIVYIKRSYSMFRKPFIFQQINEKFVDKKMKQIINICTIMNEFIECLEKLDINEYNKN